MALKEHSTRPGLGGPGSPSLSPVSPSRGSLPPSSWAFSALAAGAAGVAVSQGVCVKRTEGVVHGGFARRGVEM